MLSKTTINLIKKHYSLLMCVFLTMIIQLLITFCLFFVLRDYDPYLLKNLIGEHEILQRFPIFLFIILPFFILYGLFSLIDFVEGYYPKFFVFTLISIFYGFILALGRSFVSNENIVFALLSTIVIFSSMITFATFLINSNVEFLKYGPFLFFALFLLIIFRIIDIIFVDSDMLTNGLRLFAVLLFSVFIIFDTYFILFVKLGGDRDCIDGAINYYLDFMNIFKNILNFEED